MITAGLLYFALYKLGLTSPRAGAREEVGDPPQIDRSTEA
jgi:hypothetical protein